MSCFVGALCVVIDALLLASFTSSFFAPVFHENSHFKKNNVWDPMMVSKACLGPVGLLSGALGGLFGALWGSSPFRFSPWLGLGLPLFPLSSLGSLVLSLSSSSRDVTACLGHVHMRRWQH